MRLLPSSKFGPGCPWICHQLPQKAYYCEGGQLDANLCLGASVWSTPMQSVGPECPGAEFRPGGSN